ncbi:MAG: DUF2304 domain-containing protein [Deltaproteobacteria bacterium]|nr:DUF2304 domain-containing protein [Deltaproteobacteria bacterium]
MQSIQIVAIIFSLGILIGVVDLIRRGMLKEQYALLWLASAIVLLVLSMWRELLDMIAKALGVVYPPSLLFLVAFLFLLLIVLHFSVIISDLSEKNKKLSQEIAIFKTIFEEYKKEKNNEHRKDF